MSSSSEMMMIMMMMMMMCCLFLVMGLGGWYLTQPEEGEECEGRDKNGIYIIDEDRKCVLDECIYGYKMSTNGKKCIIKNSDSPSGSGSGSSGSDSGSGSGSGSGSSGSSGSPKTISIEDVTSSLAKKF